MPALREATAKQQAVADEYQRMAKTQQDKLLGWGEEAHKAGMAQNEWGLSQQKKYTDQADAERSRYMSEFRPFEDAMIKDAREYNTEGNFEQQAALASGDIGAAFDQQRKAAAIQRQSFGINPNSGAAQAGEGALGANEAALRASAMTSARNAARDLGWQKNMLMTNMGQATLSNQQAYTGMGMQAGGYGLGATEVGLNSTNSALAAGQGGLSAGQTNVANRQAIMQAANAATSTLGSAWNNIANTGISTWRQASDNWKTDMANKTEQRGQTMKMIGGIAGGAMGAGMIPGVK